LYSGIALLLPSSKLKTPVKSKSQKIMQTLLRMGLSLYLSLEFVVNNSDFRLVLRHKKLEVFPKKKARSSRNQSESSTFGFSASFLVALALQTPRFAM
jgi:hypothetical protein